MTAVAKIVLYTYLLTQNGTPAAYDESLAVACLQGIINRDAPQVYVLSKTNKRPEFWLEILSKDGRWLQGRSMKPVESLDALLKLAGPKVKGVVIWDPAVPATVNVATTIAGVEDAVALSPELADQIQPRWKLPVLHDLRGQFTGKETGSAKNDAYRWAIREYLAKGRCSSHLLCLFEDAYSARKKGDIGYVLTRDWAVKNRAFVLDLSPWSDEPPQDDPNQKPGTDLETYKMILAETLKASAGRYMTELTGFFAFPKYSNTPDHKSRHQDVSTEWETVWLMSPYNCYQNTISSDCFNQSFHSQAPRRPLKQKSPAARDIAIESKAYICFLMADYDSATPLYEFLPNHWNHPSRGKIPLAWGINPNLLDTYPDLISYIYETATPADTFTSDASAAGYMNPNRVPPEHMPLFIKHNRRYFREADMRIAPMVLDQDQPSDLVKDAFAQFASDGSATIVQDEHHVGGHPPSPHVWKGMPVMELHNDTCNSGHSPEDIAKIVHRVVARKDNTPPSFDLFRVVWTNPGNIARAMEILHDTHPELVFEVLDPKTFFALAKKHMQAEPKL